MTDRIKSTDSAAAMSVKVNNLMDAVDLLVNAGGTFISSAPTSSDLLVYDSGWKNKTLTAGDIIFGASTSNTQALSISPVAFTAKTESTSPNFANDFLLIYDSGSATVKKIKPNTLTKAAGSGNQVQFNSSGLLAALSSFSVNPSTGAVTMASAVVSGPITTTGSIGAGTSTPGFRIDAVGDCNASGAYRIAGNSVLSATSLGSGILYSSLTSLGTLSSLTVSGSASLGSMSCPTITGNVSCSGIISSRTDTIVSVSTSITVSPQTTYVVTANGITLTLPSTPVTGDRIKFCPSNVSINSWTVAYNGNSILGSSENLVVDTFRNIDLLWSGSSWLLA